MSNLIILDRDGVLNKLLVRPDGSTDSPMSIDEIEVFDWVPDCIKKLRSLGYHLAIATNQPAAAKGKISRDNLFQIHNEIVRLIGGSKHFIEEAICWHRSEDNCSCRKPNTGLLKLIFDVYQNIDSKYSYFNTWIVGDRATDVIAGHRFGIQTALLGPSVDLDWNMLKKHGIAPDYAGKNLRDFVEHIK